MKLPHTALAIVGTAACCAGALGPAHGRLRLRQRRLAHQREGRVLLVAPGVLLKHGKRLVDTAGTDGAGPGRATIPRPTASFSSPCTG